MMTHSARRSSARAIASTMNLADDGPMMPAILATIASPAFERDANAVRMSTRHVTIDFALMGIILD
jgi:hypothetical protein